MKRYHTHEMNKYQLLYTAHDAVTNDLVTYCQPKFNYLLSYYIVVIIKFWLTLSTALQYVDVCQLPSYLFSIHGHIFNAYCHSLICIVTYLLN